MFKRLIISAILSLNIATAASILQINGDEARASIEGAKVGHSAIIIHKFNNNASIVARALVKQIDNDEAVLQFFTFADIAQSGMPVPVIKPSVGDEVIYDYLYDNALLLAANKASYELLKTQIDANLIDPELLASAIYSQDKLMPTRNDLRQFCATWALGRIFVAQASHLKEYDCASLKLLSNKDVSSFDIKEGINFYSAIAKPAGNFYQYFESLLYQE